MSVSAVLLVSFLCSPGGEGVVLQDGKQVEGTVADLGPQGVRLATRDEPIPLYECSAILLPSPEPRSASAKEPFDPDSGPVLWFREGQVLRARLLECDKSTASVEITAPAFGAQPSAAEGNVVLKVPLEIIRGFRLREAAASSSADGAASASLEKRARAAEPDGPAATLSPQDTVYIRRPSGVLLRVSGTFESLDDTYLTMVYDGKRRRLGRRLVYGVLLAPMASAAVESQLPAVLELPGVGELPVFLKSLEGTAPGRTILWRFRGSPPRAVQRLPEALVSRARIASDRVVFLSSLEPARVEQTPLIGTAVSFPWRKDLAASGEPLRLAGTAYRKGLGVHSRTVLEYDLKGGYRAMAAVIGLDDSAGKDAAVTFRVLADAKEIFRKEFVAGDAPENLSLPVDGVQRLRLEVDYGKDGVDFGDHADWADARVTR